MTATTAPRLVALHDDDLAVPEPAQAQRVVGRAEELHAREDLAQARARSASASADGGARRARRSAPSPPQRRRSASGASSESIRSVARATTDWYPSLRSSSGTRRPNASTSTRPARRLRTRRSSGSSPSRPFSARAIASNVAVVEPEQPVGRVADRRERIEEVADARERRGRAACCCPGPREETGRAVARAGSASARRRPWNSVEVREKRSSIGSWLPARWTRDEPALACRCGRTTTRRARARARSSAPISASADGLEQRALAAAVLAEEHQPRRRRDRRGDARRTDVERAQHLEVAHLDPLDPTSAPEVVLTGVRLVPERVRVLGALRRVELALRRACAPRR